MCSVNTRSVDKTVLSRYIGGQWIKLPSVEHRRSVDKTFLSRYIGGQWIKLSSVDTYIGGQWIKLPSIGQWIQNIADSHVIKVALALSLVLSCSQTPPPL